MNNSPNKAPSPKKNRIFTILPYILIPLMMVVGIAIASQQSGNRSSEAKYYQIVQYFDKDQIFTEPYERNTQIQAQGRRHKMAVQGSQRFRFRR